MGGIEIGIVVAVFFTQLAQRLVVRDLPLRVVDDFIVACVCTAALVYVWNVS